jgi:hypothetical protein
VKPQSAKAKGRKLQQYLRVQILERFRDLLEPDDVNSRSMGASGEDLQLSPRARLLFPFSVECKNQESLNIWKALEQAEANAEDYAPLVVFKRNRSEVYCAMKLDTLLTMLEVKVP